ELEKLLAADFGFAQLPAFSAGLARMRAEGALAAANVLALRASAVLIKIADAELAAGELDAGIPHYKAAVALEPHGEGPGPVARAMHLRAEAALAAAQPDAAVRWAREEVAMAGADGAAHALLADTLFAAHDDAAAIAEYKRALEDK